MEKLLRAGFAAMGLPLDETALTRFETYYELLEERSKVMNLTAIHGETDVAQLHFLDSAALLTVEPLAGKSVIDVGTGAGFPGLPLKIAQPDISLTLLDSLDKRVRFLGDVCAATGLADVTCLHARAEEAPELRGRFDAAVSRAVARLYLLCELCLPFVRTGGVFLAMKGPDCAEELDEARSAIRKLGGTYERTVTYTVPGTDVTHSVVVIRKTAATVSPPLGEDAKGAFISYAPDANCVGRLDCQKSTTFLTKRLQSAARIICAPPARKFHTCSLSGIFSAAHVAGENDWTFFAPAGANSTRSLKSCRKRPPREPCGGGFGIS